MTHVYQNLTEVDHLLLNAQLRYELEPYIDESVTTIDMDQMPTEQENLFLASMLAWEKAPVEAIENWFDPPLRLPMARSLTDAQVEEINAITICMLYEKGVVLEYTDHLNDRELFAMIQRDILPSEEKRVEIPGKKLHWQCIDPRFEEQTWLTYYADDLEREIWESKNGQAAPTRLPVPYPRETPDG